MEVNSFDITLSHYSLTIDLFGTGRWLFFIEGSLTVAVALLAIIVLPDFPTTTRWLSPQERSLALKRMEEDGGINIGDQDETNTPTSDLVCLRNEIDNRNCNDNINNKHKGNNNSKTLNKSFFERHFLGLWLAVSDWKVWWFSIALTSEVTALSFNAFFPTLTATLGFSRTVTLVLAAPPWFVAAFVAFINARYLTFLVLLVSIY